MGARRAEPLPTLPADQFTGAERLLQLGLDEDRVLAYAAAKPRGKRLLVGESPSVRGTKFRRE
jgi:hypothetical protein